MKLARIEHWRCDEPISWRGGYTYVWVPDEMFSEEFDAICVEAQKSYLDTEWEFKKLAPVVPPGYGAALHPSTPDTITVGELRAEYAAKAKAYKEYHEALEKARKPFAWHLEQAGGGSVISFFSENAPGINAKLDWGHSHGVTIEHSPTNIGDYPFTENDEDGL